MGIQKITTVSVRSLHAGDVIWDTEIKGFGCRGRTSAKVFVMKYRSGKGRDARQFMYTIGKFGSPWTVDEARAEARRLLGRVASGENPALCRSRQTQIPTVAVAFTTFLSESEGKKSVRTLAEYKRMFLKNCSGLKNFRINDVTGTDISHLHFQLRETPVLANRIVQMLSAFFNWCVPRLWCEDGMNPCRFIEKYTERTVERIPSADELFCLGAAITAYEKEYALVKRMKHKKDLDAEQQANVSTYFVATAIRLLLLTGARRSEILTLQWRDVDLNNKQLRLPTSKTGKKTIYLSSFATQLLSDLPRLENNPYVIAGKKDGRHLVNIKDPWKRIKQHATIMLWEKQSHLEKIIATCKGQLPKDTRVPSLFNAITNEALKNNVELPVGLMDFRLHDVRHNFASLGVLENHHLKIVGALLGHRSVKTTERYAHLMDNPVHNASEQISQSIMRAIS